MSVRIIIDSASDLTKERADALGLDFLPLKTIFGNEEYLDGITLSHEAFYEKLIKGTACQRPARSHHTILSRSMHL